MLQLSVQEVTNSRLVELPVGRYSNPFSSNYSATETLIRTTQSLQTRSKTTNLVFIKFDNIYKNYSMIRKNAVKLQLGFLLVPRDDVTVSIFRSLLANRYSDFYSYTVVQSTPN